jgi:hypothetical protein
MPGDGGPGEKGKQTGMWSEGKEIGLLEVFRRFICKCDYYMAAKFDHYLTSYQRCLLLPSTDAKGEARLVEELAL